jgi:hypothetical protein
MYMPGRFRTASNPSSLSIFEASYFIFGSESVLILPVNPLQIGRDNRSTGTDFCGLKDTEKGYEKSAWKTTFICDYLGEKTQLVVDIRLRLR